MSFVYSAYGLNIRSDIAIDFLTPLKKSVAADVAVDFRSQSDNQSRLKALSWIKTYPPLNTSGTEGLEISECVGHLKLSFRRDPESVLEFILSDNNSQVTLLQSDQIPEIDAISFFIGPILGATRRLQSKSCLHASVLTLDGRAFALTGDKRAGKSTTCAMLTTCGATLVADDIAVLDYEDEQCWVQPAYPFMRLSPPAIELTGRSLAGLQNVLSVGDKKYVPAPLMGPSAFPLEAQPLDAIYILPPREPLEADMRIEQLCPNEATRILYANGYGKLLMDAAMRRQEFSLFAKFAREKHSCVVKRPDDLSRLKELGHMILDDFRKIHD